jgi:hypothetical protein
MLKWLIGRQISAFENEFGYDASYLRRVLDVDASAFFRFAWAAGISKYCKDVPVQVAYAVKIVGARREDCGPCTQLVVDMALREGVSPETLAGVLADDDECMADDVRLGVQFARAVLDHAPDADALREQIEARWGSRAVVSLSFALVAARMFPTLKYALGHGKACQRVLVSGQPVQVARLTA